MRTKVYISGPISSNIPAVREQNVRRAMGAARQLIDAGYSVLCPHLTHYLEAESECWAAEHQVWMEVDLPWVRESDVVLRLPGNSVGADMETQEAERCGVPVYCEVNDLVDNVPAQKHEAGDPRFKAVLDELWRQHCKKGADYGTDSDIFANIRASEEFGIPAWLGSMMRGNDKVARIKTYAQKGTLANEGVEDSFADLANYAIIALVLFREAKAAA